MFAAADLADLLAHEFAGLRRWRFSGALGLAGFLDRSFLRHHRSPLPVSARRLRLEQPRLASRRRVPPDRVYYQMRVPAQLIPTVFPRRIVYGTGFRLAAEHE
jgi:hypothetical protein